MSMKSPEMAVSFIKRFNAIHKSTPYDVDADKGADLAKGLPTRSIAARGDIPKFVYRLALDFKEEVEQRTGWKVLWDAKRQRHQQEEVAQALAGAMWRHQCKSANVDISKEVNVGRGPVDFKFSQGWESRTLLEVKHIGSSGFFTGAEKQVPQYLVSETIEHGVYVAIGYTDRDFETSRVKRVEDTCAGLASKLHAKVQLVIVDARPSTKVSASKQR